MAIALGQAWVSATGVEARPSNCVNRTYRRHVRIVLVADAGERFRLARHALDVFELVRAGKPFAVARLRAVVP